MEKTRQGRGRRRRRDNIKEREGRKEEEEGLAACKRTMRECTGVSHWLGRERERDANIRRADEGGGSRRRRLHYLLRLLLYCTYIRRSSANRGFCPQKAATRRERKRSRRRRDALNSVRPSERPSSLSPFSFSHFFFIFLTLPSLLCGGVADSLSPSFQSVACAHLTEGESEILLALLLLLLLPRFCSLSFSGSSPSGKRD